MQWIIFLGVGLGTARVVEWAKELAVALGLKVSRNFKSILSLLVATGGVVALCPGPWRTVVAVAAGANGLAMLTHQLSAGLQTRKDLDRLSVRMQTRRR